MSENKKTRKPRHVNFADVGLHTADNFGFAETTLTLTELVNDCPIQYRKEGNLLAVLVCQQSALIKQKSVLIRHQSDMIQILSAIKSELTNLRKDVKHEQTRVEAAREKAAKAEEKAAVAKEKAVLASPPNIKVIQAGRSLRRFETRIKKQF
jgi:hypothetical protein